MSKESFESTILPVVMLREVVVLPDAVSALIVTSGRAMAAVQEALGKDRHVFAVAQRGISAAEPGPKDLFAVGCVAEVIHVKASAGGVGGILVEGKYAAQAVDFLDAETYLQALVVRLPVKAEDLPSYDELKRKVVQEFELYAIGSERIPEEVFTAVRTRTEPVALVHAIASCMALPSGDKQALLEAHDLEEKLMLLLHALSAENERLELERPMMSRGGGGGRTLGGPHIEHPSSGGDAASGSAPASPSGGGRESELRSPEDDKELEELKTRVREAGMSREATEKAEREIQRLGRMMQISPEAAVARSFIEWLVDIPWTKTTKDRLDLERAQKILDEDHYGLKRAKERIIEYLAVHKLVKTMRGPILCFVGPPGVGKTSLGRSIARCLGRRFVRISLGGVRDEAEIRGHRRTYVGAMPGKIIQSMRKAGTINPVFLLDEIDKMSADFRGDPSSALLEVLDPEQNHTFNDHYLEVDYDLSRAMFIATANMMDNIPHPLLDRMEMLYLPGYTDDEKRQIARRFLVPRQLEGHGLRGEFDEALDQSIDMLIRNYTREAGVRSLDREVAKICRKLARNIVGKTAAAPAKRKPAEKPVKITPVVVRELLGPPPYRDTELDRAPELGLAIGMAWTETGGEILPVETTITPGKGGLLLTGKLGEVMQESAKTAFTWIRAHAREFGVKPSFANDTDIHVHIPEGAIPKDGPSAGVVLAASMVSALSGVPVRQDVAMTGEITLLGKVIKIGGLKQKMLAALRHKMKIVVIPEENLDDWTEIRKEIDREVDVRAVRRLDEALRIALGIKEKRVHRPPSADAKRSRAGAHPPRATAP